MRRAFDDRHRETFGYADADNDAEIVNLRLVSTGVTDKPVLDLGVTDSGGAASTTRPVWFGDWSDTPVLDRETLAAGRRLQGPAIVEEAGGTTIIPPGWQVDAHASGALLCRRSE